MWNLRVKTLIQYFALPATDMEQNSLMTSLHSTFTHDMTASKDVVDKDQAHEVIVKVCYIRHRIINATSFMICHEIMSDKL